MEKCLLANWLRKYCMIITTFKTLAEFKSNEVVYCLVFLLKLDEYWK